MSTRSPSPNHISNHGQALPAATHQHESDLYGDLVVEDNSTLSNIASTGLLAPTGEEGNHQDSQPDNEPLGFASYFGGNDSAQQHDDIFSYDYSAPSYNPIDDSQTMLQTTNEYFHHESYQDNNVCEYFSSEYQQLGESGFDQNNFHNYQYSYEIDHQQAQFVDNAQTSEDFSQYWPQTGYSSESRYYNVDLNTSSSYISPGIPKNSAQLKFKNFDRVREPHPIVSFALGGKVLLTFVKGSTQNTRALTQDIEITARPGKLRVCLLLSVVKNTRLEKCITSFPGPIPSSANISSICQKKLSICHTSHLLWKLVDNLASNKGSWNAEKITALLTESSESNNHRYTVPCLTQGPTSFQVHNEDVLHLQSLVTVGKHKEAAEFAASKGLWSHALIISLNCDVKIHSSIIQRYRDSYLVPGSQLHSVYSALAGCPIQSTEFWKENLAALFNVSKGSLAIFQLGELLLAEGNTEAAHACFLLSGRLEKIGLLGLREPSTRVFRCPYPDLIQLTECFEAAVCQKDSGFVMETLVYAKFAYACLLVDLGLSKSAFRYLSTVSRSIADLSKLRKNTFPANFGLVVKQVEHLLSQIASPDDGSEGSGVLGSIFNNLSKLLIGKEEVDQPIPRPLKMASSQISEPYSTSTSSDPAKIEKPNAASASEPPKDGLISKLTGLFRSRNGSPNGDLSEIEEEEKFEWDPVTKKWISNLTGPPKPAEPVKPETVITRPPILNPRPNASVSQLPRNSLHRTAINSRYALQEKQYITGSDPVPFHQPMHADVNNGFIRTPSSESIKNVPARPAVPSRVSGISFPPNSRTFTTR